MNLETCEPATQPPEVLIEQLLAFGVRAGLLANDDVWWTRNGLLDLLQVAQPVTDPGELERIWEQPLDSPVELLEQLLTDAFKRAVVSEDTTTGRDLLDTRIMGILTPRPAEVNRKFKTLLENRGIEEATRWFYQLCIDCNYIRMTRIRRNLEWTAPTTYGELQITVNLSKPEKDPREIAASRSVKETGYPGCLLCPSNVGYAGDLNHPARQNIRLIPLELCGESWFFQYSPYVYYNEHCIVLTAQHQPMKVTRQTFRRLMAFLQIFPHYFIGSNAGLPIVGGSILAHEHYQGGRHVFPMTVATARARFESKEHPQVSVSILNWPMSTIRLNGPDSEELIDMADQLLQCWSDYSDASVGIIAYTGSGEDRIPHNAVTPIARRTTSGRYELDLVLRNNLTTDEHPDGVFHPHKEVQHIKKENIGLIEVMGLAILPGRLQEELRQIISILAGETDSRLAWEDPTHPLDKHGLWINELVAQHGTSLSIEEAWSVVKEAVGAKFNSVLEHASVFKGDVTGQAAFRCFLETSGYTGWCG